MEFSAGKQKHMATEMYTRGEHKGEMDMPPVCIDYTFII